MKTYKYSVATGKVNPLIKASREAAEFIKNQRGFYKVALTQNGMLWLFDSLNEAKTARNLMECKGIQCGVNICKFEELPDGSIEFAEQEV